MKRLLPILLAVLLLAGCSSGEAPVPAEPPVSEPATEVKLVSLYDADSTVEQQTAGVVRAYPLGDGEYSGLMAMGQKLLVISGDGSLTILQGELGEVASTGIADLAQEWTQKDLIAAENGLIYYARETREVVLLDAQLRQTQRIALPEESQGNPVLQQDGQVFYCVGTQIRALNLNTGISRLVREHSCASQELTGSFFNDTIIGCRVTDEAGIQRTVYLFADTGEVIQTDSDGYQLDSVDNSYFAQHLTEEEKQYVFGSLDGEPMCLYPKEDFLAEALSLNGAIGYTVAEDGLHLAFYDLTAGKRTAAVILKGVGMPQALMADAGYVWFIADGVLYRWEMAAASVTEDTVYTGPRYTVSQPDLDGLAVCQERVQGIRDTYGLKLYIWEEAESLAGDYVQEKEYRVSVINESLDQIESLLRSFPEGFLKQTGDVSVYLAGSLKNGEPCAQYREGAACHVVITGQETAKSFLWGLGFAVDTKVLGNSREFDTWDNLNPKGFEYTYDYEANAQREKVEKYLDAFIDQQSMSFPTEDRSRIFAYAVLPEGAEYFTHDDLQDKLLRLCEGIREAYDLEKSTDIFPWEQYLDKPIAKEK